MKNTKTTNQTQKQQHEKQQKIIKNDDDAFSVIKSTTDRPSDDIKSSKAPKTITLDTSKFTSSKAQDPYAGSMNKADSEDISHPSDKNNNFQLFCIPNDRGYILLYNRSTKQAVRYFKTDKLGSQIEFIKQLDKDVPIYIKNYESNQNSRYTNKHVNKYNLNYLQSLFSGFGFTDVQLIQMKPLAAYIKHETADSPGTSMKDRALFLICSQVGTNPLFEIMLESAQSDPLMVETLAVLAYVNSGYVYREPSSKKVDPSTAMITKNSDKIAKETMEFLEQNENVSDSVSELLSQTNVGIKIMFAGMARRTAKRLEVISDAQEHMEAVVFSKEHFDAQSDWDKANLLKLCDDIGQRKLKLLQDISSKIDFNEVTAELGRIQTDEIVNDGVEIAKQSAEKKKMATILKRMIKGQ